MRQRILALPWRAKLRLAWLLWTDKRVPLGAKVIVPGVVTYLLLPLDIIPDFVPVLGQLDDLFLLAGALWLFLRLCPREVVEMYVQGLEGV